MVLGSQLTPFFYNGIRENKFFTLLKSRAGEFSRSLRQPQQSPRLAHIALHFLCILDLLQTEFRYEIRKGPREISARTVFTVFTVFICISAFNYRKYRKFRTGRNLTRTFPKIVPKFVLQKVYITIASFLLSPFYFISFLFFLWKCILFW